MFITSGRRICYFKTVPFLHISFEHIFFTILVDSIILGTSALNYFVFEPVDKEEIIFLFLALYLFDLILYVPVNNFSAMLRWVFLG